MNTLPLNLIIFTSTAGHFGHSTLATTLKHYKSKLGGDLSVFQQRFCHIKVKPEEADKLPDIIDILLDNDIRPIVTEGEWTRGLSHGNAYLKDQFKVYNTEALHAAPYSLVVEDDSPIHVKQNSLADYLIAAVNTLAANKDILHIRFLRDGVLTAHQPISDLYDRVETLDFNPHVARTRDLFIAAKILQDNAAQFQNTQCEAAFRIASDMLSYSPYRYLCFNINLATSYHIGAPDYLEIIKQPDFTGIGAAPVITKWQPGVRL